MIRALAACSLAAALAAGPAAYAQSGAGAEAMFHATTLSVTADGEATALPDQARITLGVTTQAPAAAEAFSANAAQMSKVVAAVAAAGVAERDIRTSQLSLNPQYAYRQNQPPQLTGYQATNEVQVTVRDPKRLGAIVDAASAAGANQVQGISFVLKDRAAAEEAARTAAVQALEAKAQSYARAAGYKVVRLVTLSEGGAPAVIQPRMYAAQTTAAAPTPISTGETAVRVTVSGLYELAR
jgi:uncharacterized protein YggE